MLEIYICEDDFKQQSQLSAFVENYCVMQNLDARVILASHSPEDVLVAYGRSENPALFLLDIELRSEINGIELASRIRQHNRRASIVFLTVHPEMTYLTFQYKVEAMDYILKGNFEAIKPRVMECIQMALERNILAENVKTLQIKVYDSIVYLEMDKIIYIETSELRNKLIAHTKNRRLEFNGKLKQIEEKLDDRFVRVHKSYVINKEKVLSIQKAESTVMMENRDELPLSRTGKKLLS